MPDADLARLVAEMTQAKQHADEVLKSLVAARKECEAQLEREGRPDLMKLVKGRSSIEEACSTAQRLVEVFDRALRDASDRASRQAPSTAGESPSAAATEALLTLKSLSLGWALRPRAAI